MEATFPRWQMGLRSFYTTAHRLARRSLIHKALTIFCLHPCAPPWRSTRSIPQLFPPMHRRMILVEQRVPAAMSPVQRAGGANPALWWSVVDATRTCVCGTCRLGASLLFLFL